jgi:hypothetical protein
MDTWMDTEKRRWLIPVSILVLILAVQTGCAGASRLSPTPTFTVINLPSPTPSGPGETPAASIPLPVIPTSTPACVSDLTFMSDVTIPDGTVVAAGGSLDKQWQVLNSGSCNWDNLYRLRLISGDAMGAALEQALYPARVGSLATIRILFKAPPDPGEYISEWQAFDSAGLPFGDSFFMKIVVQ